jgi:LysM repeat protein
MPRRLRFLISLIGGFLLVLLSWGAQSLLARPALQTSAPVIVAAGDISNCSNYQDEETARLVEAVPEATVLTLGDNAYEVGSLQEYNECYGPTWGRFLARTKPAAGNHEYGAGNASGYFTYFGAAATPLEPGCTTDCKGYYSFDLGAWHLIALNSEIDTNPGSDQEQWLRADLAAHPNVCTLAYWHRPRWSSGREGGAAPALIQALYDYGADVVLVGHEHHYERFAPQTPQGALDPERGVRQFTVGTGGAPLRDFRFIQPNSEARNAETWGILKMTLHPDRYDWEFIPIAGQSFRDSGSAPCVTAGSVPPAPIVDTTTVTDPAPAPTAVATTAVAAPTTSAVATPAAAAPATVPPEGLTYTVQAGDTVSLIALRYGLDWRQVAQANGLSDPYIIEVGQVLRLGGLQTTITASAAPATTVVQTSAPLANPTAAPATNTAAATAPAATDAQYTVKAGDTLYTIAIRNGVTWQALAAANGLDENAILQIGQQLVIPGRTTAATTTTAPVQPTAASAPTTGTPQVHTVASGETIISIAARYGVNWQQLLALNGLTADSVLQVGQQLRLQ